MCKKKKLVHSNNVNRETHSNNVKTERQSNLQSRVQDSWKIVLIETERLFRTEKECNNLHYQQNYNLS